MEADVLKDATPEKVRCAEDHLTDMFVARGKQLGDGSADHQADQLGGPADRPDIRGRNTFPSAEDSDTIGDFHNLIEPVRDV